MRTYYTTVRNRKEAIKIDGFENHAEMISFVSQYLKENSEYYVCDQGYEENGSESAYIEHGETHGTYSDFDDDF